MSDKKDNEVFDRISPLGTPIDLFNTDLNVGSETLEDGTKVHYVSQRRPDGKKAFYKGTSSYGSETLSERLAQADATHRMKDNPSDSTAFSELPTYIQEANAEKNKILEKEAQETYDRLIEQNKPEEITRTDTTYTKDGLKIIESGYNVIHSKPNLRFSKVVDYTYPSGKKGYKAKVIVEHETPDGIRQYYGEHISLSTTMARSFAADKASRRYYINAADSIPTNKYTPDDIFNGILEQDNLHLWDDPSKRELQK